MPTLVELGLTKRESADAQKLAAAPEADQLGRRNLTDDQRAMIADAVAEIESKLARIEAGKKGGRGNKKAADTPSASFRDRSREPRAKTAKAAKVSERRDSAFPHPRHPETSRAIAFSATARDNR